MRFTSSLRIRGKAILLVMTLLVIFAVAVVGFTYVSLNKEVDLEMTASAASAMRVLAVTFTDAHKGARVDITGETVSNVVIDAMPAFSGHEVVDQTAKMIAGAATVFDTRSGREHVRVSTTVKTENGARAIGTALAADPPAKAHLDRGEPYYGAATLFGRAFITGYQPIKNKAGQTVGALFIGIPIERAEAMVSRLTGSTVAVTSGVLLVLALIAAVIVTRAVRPLQGLTAGMKELAGGNFAVVLPGLGRKDEIGDMAQAVETFKIKAAEKAEREAEERRAEEARVVAEKRAVDEREAAEKLAAEERLAAERKTTMRKLADAFEAAVGGIVETVSRASCELESAATTLTKTADTTQQLSTTVASASEEASVNVQSVASATEELTSSVTEISRQVQQSTAIANEAVKQAQATDARINALSHAADRIGDVVKLITAVAEQTNLLALNATIEAARAGEAGKGFAVVASEVKLLAAQTAKATNEISQQISGMQAETGAAVGAIKEIGATISHVSEIASTIAAAVEEQGAATNEISRNIQQASRGTALVASNIVEVNHGASATGSASSQVLTAAQQLSAESGRLKSEVDKFLMTVRAA